MKHFDQKASSNSARKGAPRLRQLRARGRARGSRRSRVHGLAVGQPQPERRRRDSMQRDGPV
eukprot:12966629-Alexandrium_andersonii.AAC.1